MELFSEKTEQRRSEDKSMPLAIRMRPGSLEEFVGQKHILAEGKLLRRSIESDRINSLILYGPPGTGKTALALIISKTTDAYFEEVNAAASNVSQIRKIISDAKKRKERENKKTILFIDEIHRFNRAQQDVLIPEVEKGIPVLIGVTTHNPFFSIVSPLISRSIIFQFEPLKDEDIKKILKRAIKDERGLGNLNLNLTERAEKFLIKQSKGDARRALNALEIGALTTKPHEKDKINYTIEVAQECMQKSLVRYDKGEDLHYDTISAYIKSIRGSDPDAAIYWLAKMLYAGEDPMFIARRMVIAASEDIGNADPQAINIANSAMQITQFIGMPECQLTLAQATIYLATAPKSNSATKAINKAMEDLEEEKVLRVPVHLRNVHYTQVKHLDRGKSYKSPHNFKEHYVQQDYLPEKRKYFYPTELGYEKKIKERLERIKKLNKKNE